MKLKSLSVVVCSLLLGVYQTQTSVLKHWPISTHFFSRDPKVWLSFVEMICKKVDEDTAATTLFIGIPRLIKKQTAFVQQIVKKAKHMVKFTCKEKIEHFSFGGHNWLPKVDAVQNHILLHILGDIVFTTEGHRVSWRLYRETYTSCLYTGKIDPIHKAPVHVKNYWDFKLPPLLTLNFSFLQIKIKCIHGLCTRGNISIISNTMEFPYCGEHSNFAIYPQYSQLISLKLDTYSTLQIIFDAIFSVLSSNGVSNVVGSNMTISHIYTDAFANFDNILFLFNVALYTIHVQVHKYQILNIQSNKYSAKGQVQIFDGPGLDSAQILQKLSNSKIQTFSCKTFQAVIQFFTSASFHNEIKFYASAASILEVNVTKGKSFKIQSGYSSRRNYTFAVVRITVNGSLFTRYLNISILHLSYGKHSTSGCKFAGVTLYKPGSDFYILWYALCKMLFVDTTKHRSLCSNTKSLLLGIYSYAEYGHISGTSIDVDICVFSHFCLFNGENYHTDQCHSFLSHINSLSYVTFFLTPL